MSQHNDIKPGRCEACNYHDAAYKCPQCGKQLCVKCSGWIGKRKAGCKCRKET